MDAVGEWRFLEAPSERPGLLSFGQALAIFQAFGLTGETPTAAVSVRSVGDSVVLMGGGEPLLVRSRAEWRESLAAWRPTAICPEKG